MTEDRSRRLAAVMFTDVVGYTALMQDDEEAARVVRLRHREALEAAIAAHGGELVQYLGDGSLSSFPSAVRAVSAAVDVQQALREEVPLRIGIHQGEIAFDDQGIYGDSVNVASRVMGLGTAGSVLVSEKAQDELKNQRDFSTASLGQFNLKNVKHPMVVYAVRREGLDVPTREEVLGSANGSGRISPRPEVLGSEGEQRNSIVVLPFANLSPDPEDDYFTDGMTEEIINAVANVPGLRVIARTSAFAFKGVSQDVREIGKQLGVGTVLEGSVRRAGARLRITAQLIDVSGGHHLWSERYDRHLEDVFAIQDDIAKIIARRLRPDEGARAARERPTDDLDAYEAFLRGRFYHAKGTPEDYAKSVEHYERASQLDPDFAQAYAGQAETWVYWALLSEPSDRFPRAKRAAKKALEIDQALSDAHASLGSVRFFLDWDWIGAIEAFERAVALNSNSATALRLSSGALANLGSTDAVAYARRSVALDPLSAQANRALAWAFFQAGAFSESLEYARQALQLAPNFLIAHVSLGEALTETGPLDEAEAAYRRVLEISPDHPYARGGLAQVYVRMGRREDAREQIRDLERLASGTEGHVAVSAAWAHASLGNVDEAFEWIDRAIEARDSAVASLPTLSWWDPLRSDPRFEALLRKLNFPEWSYAPERR